MDERGIRTSSQDNSEDIYNFDRCEISNLGNEICTLESIVRAKLSITRVQLTLQTKADDVDVLWYSLGSLGTYSTLEGDVLDHISCGENSVDDGEKAAITSQWYLQMKSELDSYIRNSTLMQKNDTKLEPMTFTNL